MGHEIDNSGRPFHAHHYNILINLSDSCLGIEMEFFKKIKHFHYDIHFTPFTPKLSPLGVDGHENVNFLSLDPTAATFQIWLRLAL